MTTPTSKYQQQNQLIMETLTEIKRATEGSIAFQARMVEKMENVEKKLNRVDMAIFGNGKPGLCEEVHDQTRRITLLEKREAECPIAEIAEMLEDITDRHVVEDRREEKAEIRRTAGDAEYRKFRYGLASAIILIIVDIVASALGFL